MHEDRILINKLKNFENINSNFLTITLILIGSILLAISAKVQVPFWPVPMTMQTFVIFLIGMTYSIRLSFATVSFYLFQGAIGLPVFATGGGIAYSEKEYTDICNIGLKSSPVNQILIDESLDIERLHFYLLIENTSCMY